MSRNGFGIYSTPPGSTAVDNTIIDPVVFNTLISDLETDANTARPVVAGGTGATTAAAARAALGLPDIISQGTLSGSSLVIAIPAEFKAIELDFWEFLPSVSGAFLAMSIGSGTIGSPAWGTNHYDQVISYNTAIVLSSSGPGNSFPLSLGQATGQFPGFGSLRAVGFNSSSRVVGFHTRKTVDTTPVRAFSTGGFSEEGITNASLIRIVSSSGTMAGNYRLTGVRA